MTKRAKDLIQSTTYTESTHPAVCALVEFAVQNPGVEFGNYGSDRSAYYAECRSITNDWHRFKAALREAASLGLTDENIISAAPGAFSGRLEWALTGDKKELGNDSGEREWNYTTGQYFPTEYRKAAATVLECAIHAHKASRPAAAREVFTIAALRELNQENGGHWFDKASMRFFGSRIESGILTGHFFISSEQPPHGRRAYTVRTFDDKGNIDTHGELCGYSTRNQAIKAAHAAHAENLNKPVLAAS